MRGDCDPIRARVVASHALAQRLLALGTPVTEVALESGYANPSAFGHAFRQFFGVTPSALRKRM